MRGSNFDVAVKIDSALTDATQYSEQGLMVEGDATDYIRYEIGAAGTTTMLSLTVTVAGAQSSKLAIVPFTGYATHTYLRLQRVGTTYTAYWYERNNMDPGSIVYRQHGGYGAGSVRGQLRCDSEPGYRCHRHV
jgi:regulation of enolase protein 1 (concanavalin A-like superfamily)